MLLAGLIFLNGEQLGQHPGDAWNLFVYIYIYTYIYIYVVVFMWKSSPTNVCETAHRLLFFIFIFFFIYCHFPCNCCWTLKKIKSNNICIQHLSLVIVELVLLVSKVSPHGQVGWRILRCRAGPYLVGICHPFIYWRIH